MRINERYPVARVALVAALLWNGAVVRAQTSFIPIRPGIDLEKITWTPKGAGAVTLTIVRADLKKVALSVVDTRYILPTDHARKKPSDTQIAYSLREVGRLQKPLIAINGGFTGSLVRPVPVGLIISSGKTTARTNTQAKEAGAICVTASGAPTIRALADLAELKCENAIQSRPIVVIAGANGISSDQRGIVAARSLFGLDSQNHVYFIVATSASLYDLGEGLGKRGGIGLNLDSVINLDGDADSGLIVMGKDAYGIYGNADATITSALVLKPVP